MRPQLRVARHRHAAVALNLYAFSMNTTSTHLGGPWPPNNHCSVCWKATLAAVSSNGFRVLPIAASIPRGWRPQKCG